MGIIIDITRYIKRRQKRLDARGVRMDFEVGVYPADESGDGGKKSSGGNTRLPYGLCKAAGIDTEGMTPSEAWAALEGEIGIKPKEAYEKLEKDGDAKELAKEAKKKAKEAEVPEKEKLTGSEHLVGVPKDKKKEASDRFRAAIDMADSRAAIEKVLGGVPVGGKVYYSVETDDSGTVEKYATKNSDGSFTTDKGTTHPASKMAYLVRRSEKQGHPTRLDADDFTMPVSGEFEAKKEETSSPTPTPAPTPAPEPPAAPEPEKPAKAKKAASTAKMVIPAAPAVTGTKIPVRTTKKVDIPKLKTVINAQKTRDDWAAKHPKYGPYQEKLTAGMKYLFDNNEFCMNFRPQVLESILRKGFLNQMQTATDPEITHKTGGSYTPDGRKKASHNMFGTPVGTRAADYERYGYLGNPLNPATEAMGFAKYYGSVTVLFKKDRVKNRVTYTYSDSLYYGSEGEAVPGKDGDDTSWEGAGFEGLSYYDDGPSSMMQKVMDAPSKKLGLDDVVTSGYLELQYHGDLTMSDVDTIVFRSKLDYSYVTPEVQEALDALGVKVVKLWEKKKK